MKLIILFILFIWLMSSCTVAMIHLNQCKLACPGNMASFESTGEDIACQCYRKRRLQVPDSR